MGMAVLLGAFLSLAITQRARVVDALM